MAVACLLGMVNGVGRLNCELVALFVAWTCVDVAGPSNEDKEDAGLAAALVVAGLRLGQQSTEGQDIPEPGRWVFLPGFDLRLPPANYLQQ